MKITSKQKKFYVPLIGFIFSLGMYLLLFGSLWCLVFSPLLGLFVGVFGYYNFEPIIDSVGEWFKRDGLK